MHRAGRDTAASTKSPSRDQPASSPPPSKGSKKESAGRSKSEGGESKAEGEKSPKSKAEGEKSPKSKPRSRRSLFPFYGNLKSLTGKKSEKENEEDRGRGKGAKAKNSNNTNNNNSNKNNNNNNNSDGKDPKGKANEPSLSSEVTSGATRPTEDEEEDEVLPEARLDTLENDSDALKSQSSSSAGAGACKRPAEAQRSAPYESPLKRQPFQSFLHARYGSSVSTLPPRLTGLPASASTASLDTAVRGRTLEHGRSSVVDLSEYAGSSPEGEDPNDNKGSSLANVQASQKNHFNNLTYEELGFAKVVRAGGVEIFRARDSRSLGARKKGLSQSRRSLVGDVGSASTTSLGPQPRPSGASDFKTKRSYVHELLHEASESDSSLDGGASPGKGLVRRIYEPSKTRNVDSITVTSNSNVKACLNITVIRTPEPMRRRANGSFRMSRDNYRSSMRMSQKKKKGHKASSATSASAVSLSHGAAAGEPSTSTSASAVSPSGTTKNSASKLFFLRNQKGASINTTVVTTTAETSASTSSATDATFSKPSIILNAEGKPIPEYAKVNKKKISRTDVPEDGNESLRSLKEPFTRAFLPSASAIRKLDLKSRKEFEPSLKVNPVKKSESFKGGGSRVARKNSITFRSRLAREHGLEQGSFVQAQAVKLRRKNSKKARKAEYRLSVTIKPSTVANLANKFNTIISQNTQSKTAGASYHPGTTRRPGGSGGPRGGATGLKKTILSTKNEMTKPIAEEEPDAIKPKDQDSEKTEEPSDDGVEEKPSSSSPSSSSSGVGPGDNKTDEEKVCEKLKTALSSTKFKGETDDSDDEFDKKSKISESEEEVNKEDSESKPENSSAAESAETDLAENDYELSAKPDEAAAYRNSIQSCKSVGNNYDVCDFSDIDYVLLRNDTGVTEPESLCDKKIYDDVPPLEDISTMISKSGEAHTSDATGKTRREMTSCRDGAKVDHLQGRGQDRPSSSVPDVIPSENLELGDRLSSLLRPNGMSTCSVEDTPMVVTEHVNVRAAMTPDLFSDTGRAMPEHHVKTDSIDSGISTEDDRISGAGSPGFMLGRNRLTATVSTDDSSLEIVSSLDRGSDSVFSSPTSLRDDRSRRDLLENSKERSDSFKGTQPSIAEEEICTEASETSSTLNSATKTPNDQEDPSDDPELRSMNSSTMDDARSESGSLTSDLTSRAGSHRSSRSRKESGGKGNESRIYNSIKTVVKNTVKKTKEKDAERKEMDSQRKGNRSPSADRWFRRGRSRERNRKKDKDEGEGQNEDGCKTLEDAAEDLEKKEEGQRRKEREGRTYERWTFKKLREKSQERRRNKEKHKEELKKEEDRRKEEERKKEEDKKKDEDPVGKEEEKQDDSSTTTYGRWTLGGRSRSRDRKKRKAKAAAAAAAQESKDKEISTEEGGTGTKDAEEVQAGTEDDGSSPHAKPSSEGLVFVFDPDIYEKPKTEADTSSIDDAFAATPTKSTASTPSAIPPPPKTPVPDPPTSSGDTPRTSADELASSTENIYENLYTPNVAKLNRNREKLEGRGIRPNTSFLWSEGLQVPPPQPPPPPMQPERKFSSQLIGVGPRVNDETSPERHNYAEVQGPPSDLPAAYDDIGAVSAISYDDIGAPSSCGYDDIRAPSTVGGYDPLLPPSEGYDPVNPPRSDSSQYDDCEGSVVVARLAVVREDQMDSISYVYDDIATYNASQTSHSYEPIYPPGVGVIASHLLAPTIQEEEVPGEGKAGGVDNDDDEEPLDESRTSGSSDGGAHEVFSYKLTRVGAAGDSVAASSTSSVTPTTTTPSTTTTPTAAAPKTTPLTGSGSGRAPVPPLNLTPTQDGICTAYCGVVVPDAPVTPSLSPTEGSKSETSDEWVDVSDTETDTSMQEGNPTTLTTTVPFVRIRQRSRRWCRPKIHRRSWNQGVRDVAATSAAGGEDLHSTYYCWREGDGLNDKMSRRPSHAASITSRASASSSRSSSSFSSFSSARSSSSSASSSSTSSTVTGSHQQEDEEEQVYVTSSSKIVIGQSEPPLYDSAYDPCYYNASLLSGGSSSHYENATIRSIFYDDDRAESQEISLYMEGGDSDDEGLGGAGGDYEAIYEVISPAEEQQQEQQQPATTPVLPVHTHDVRTQHQPLVPTENDLDDSFDSDESEDSDDAYSRLQPPHSRLCDIEESLPTSLHSDVHVTNSASSTLTLPSSPTYIQQNQQQYGITKFAEAANLGMRRLRRNWSQTKNEVRSGLSRITKKSTFTASDLKTNETVVPCEVSPPVSGEEGKRKWSFKSHFRKKSSAGAMQPVRVITPGSKKETATFYLTLTIETGDQQGKGANTLPSNLGRCSDSESLRSSSSTQEHRNSNTPSLSSVASAGSSNDLVMHRHSFAPVRKGSNSSNYGPVRPKTAPPAPPKGGDNSCDFRGLRPPIDENDTSKDAVAYRLNQILSAGPMPPPGRRVLHTSEDSGSSSDTSPVPVLVPPRRDNLNGNQKLNSVKYAAVQLHNLHSGDSSGDERHAALAPEVSRTIISNMPHTRSSVASSGSHGSSEGYIRLGDIATSPPPLPARHLPPRPLSQQHSNPQTMTLSHSRLSPPFNHVDSDSCSYLDLNTMGPEELSEDIDDSPYVSSHFANEPLYQFYAATVLERATHNQGDCSSEDDYEVINDGTRMLPLARPTAMELVTPTDGRRTLWCELPEVVNSGLLDEITPTQRKLQEAMFEVITSEASYLKSLNVLVTHFLQCPEFSGDDENSVISRRECHSLFSDILPVKRCSELFLADLERRWQESVKISTISDIVHKHASINFSTYVKYCSNQIYQDRILRELKENNPRFVEVLARLEMSPVCQSLAMHSFLMLPMQRVTRLPLLVDAIFHRLEYGTAEWHQCKKALAMLTKIVAECNEGARRMERMEEMLIISRQLDQKEVRAIPLISASRWLVKRGELTRLTWKETDARLTFGRRISKHSLYFFLFTDLLVVTKKKSDDQYTVLDYCPRNMLQVLELDPGDKFFGRMLEGYKNLLIMTMLQNHEKKTLEMVLSCPLESDRARWVDAVTPRTSENPDERIYEEWDCPQVQAVHSVTATQPDELSLEASDVVNVLRKMADGLYHGERIRDGERGWFPSSSCIEIASAHVRARNLRQRYRLLAISGTFLDELKKEKERYDKEEKKKERRKTLTIKEVISS